MAPPVQQTNITHHSTKAFGDGLQNHVEVHAYQQTVSDGSTKKC